MRWWQCGDCGLDGLWVLVDLGGHGIGCGLVFRWSNQCGYCIWVVGLVVVCCLGGCGLVFGWPNQWWFGVWCWVFFFFVSGCWGVCGGGVGGGCCWFAGEIETDQRGKREMGEEREMIYIYYFIML